MYRSMLFVPGDSERKIAKAETVHPDAVILDLEDSVAPSQKKAARAVVADYLRATLHNRRCAVFVRINPLHTDDALQDLVAVMAGAPDGIVQPKASHPQEVEQLGLYLEAFEAQHDIKPKATRIVPIVTETPEALFTLGHYKNTVENEIKKGGQRLSALTWGAEDLASAIGAITNKDEDGQWSEPFKLTRSLCLFAAAAAKVAAIDTLYADFKDMEGLATNARRARRDGFTGKLAIHPDQVATINQAFTPTSEEVAKAQNIIALFAENPKAGVLSMDGLMLDLPHLIQAQKIVDMAAKTRL